MMRAMGLAEFARLLGVPAPARDASFGAVSTDTRTLAPGSLFVALRGENFDGHDFVAEAVRRGAAALLCSRPIDASVPVLAVADTLVALGELGRFNRELFTGTVVALTGSAGKTTTKEMIAAILGRQGVVLATAGNLNNEIGVPLTLLALHPALRYAVIEMGAAKPGDIRYLGALVRPDVAVLTNALPAHLQGFGSLQAVAATKGEIYDALGPDGVAVLNVDEPFADAWLARIGARTVLRASARGAVTADVRAEDVMMHEGNASFRLVSAAGAVRIALDVPGVQQVANAVCAAAAAVALGLGLDAIRDGLESLAPVSGRMQRRVGARGCVLIDDSYNANPGSVRAAIDSLATFAGTRVLALGNMAELGEQSRELHREIGAHARARGIDRLVACGPHADAVAEGFGPGASALGSREAVAAACREFDRAGSVILVKGSRSAGMEAVVAALVEAESGAAGTGRH